MKNSVIRIVAFVAILAVCVYAAATVLSFKSADNIYDVDNFYQQPRNSVDMLVLGTSHAYSNINTGTLWDEFGIASCIFAGSEQPMWNTYYYLKEALKYQKPQLIVLEAFGGTLDYEYSEDIRVVQNTYGLKPGRNKIDAIKVSAPKEKWNDFVLEYTRYHSRYTDLDHEDFGQVMPDKSDTECMGYVVLNNTKICEWEDYSYITETAELAPKSEQYYRQVIELAQLNDIPICVVVAPYAGLSSTDQMKFNRMAQIAQEYGVQFANFNDYVERMDVNYGTDAADYSHLNYRGTPKFTRYMATWIQANYGITDRRGDEAYDRYQENADKVFRLSYNDYIQDSYNLQEKIECFSNDTYSVRVSVEGNVDPEAEDTMMFLGMMGFTMDELAPSRPTQTGGANASSDGKKGSTIAKEFNAGPDAAPIINNKAIKNGINVVVYDKELDYTAAIWGINFDEEYAICNGAKAGL